MYETIHDKEDRLFVFKYLLNKASVDDAFRLIEDEQYRNELIDGFIKGEERIASLTHILFQNNRIEDIKKMCTDSEFRNQLYDEFELT